ncbi:MAG: hypothetical protein CMH50_14805, partial [Myxococcales bacterium]|nr:hypothetical protein [Myxococcales bacterium]
MRILALSSIVLMFACSAPLPALLSDDSPELRTEAALELMGARQLISRTEGQPAELNRLVVGEAYEVRYRLLDNRQQPFENRGVTVEVVAEGFDRLADFPRGGTCTTDAAGECAVVFKLLGPTDIANLRAVAGGGSVVLETALGLEPALAKPVVRLNVEGVGNITWQPGEQDLLALQAPLTLSADQAQSAMVTVKLEDAFGNPLSGRRVQIYSVDGSPEQPVPDAGPDRED